jgi:hypothetical protein
MYSLYKNKYRIFSFIIVLGGGTLEHLQRYLKFIKCIILEFNPSTTLLYSLTSPPYLEQF